MESTITAVGKPQMLVGLNYPWAFNKYGWYFGPKKDEPWIAENFYYEREAFEGGPKMPSAFSLHLDILRSRFDIRLIRLFLLCNAQNLGEGDPWRIISPLPPEFCEHLTIILDTLRRHGMKAILSILDFGIGSPPYERKQGRHKIVTDPWMRSDFVERVVVPFAKVGRSYHDVIYAWEAMNEPGWLNRNTWPHPKSVCTAAATIDEINGCLRAVLAGIRSVDPGVPTTVGHRFERDLACYETGDIPQYHYYPKYIPDVIGPHTLSGTDPNELPNVVSMRRKPILGEIGASASQGDAWIELLGRDAGSARKRVYERLLCAWDKGYEVALVWPDELWDGDPKEDPPHFSVDAQQGLLDFTRRSAVPT